MHRFFTLFFIIIFSQGIALGQHNVLKLDSNWTFHKAKKNKTYPAKVPGSIYADLYRNQLIPNPYFGGNEKQLQWIETESWVYECRFSLSNKELQSQNIRLNLDGIDTYANIYLNDSLILKTQSMFLAYHKEIKNLLKENNILRIEILPPLSQIPKDDSLKYSGGPQAHVRKAAFQFGWDWAPRYAAGGIWRGISLEFDNLESIYDVQFKLINFTDYEAIYRITTFYHLEANKPYNLVFSDTSEKINANINFTPTNDKGVLDFTLKIREPKLWWPYRKGEAFLYNFNIRIEQDGKILDQVNRKIGIREIELVNTEDSMGTSFYFKVNGRPIYIKGANYVPQDVFVGMEENKAYNSRKLIADVVNSNMNMIRIWGGGVYESDAFYELCDSAGIMVWQDFMFANSVYPDDSTFLSLVEKEAFQQVDRLSQHPCIALWCGNNEISEAWHNWGWQKQFGYSPTDSARLWDNYLNIFDTILPQAVAHFSNGTPYWQSSPQYGRGNPKSYSHGDLHYWGVWHDGHSFDSLETKTGRFMSEFGFQSYPSLASINRFSDAKSRNDKELQNHQKHSRGDAIIEQYMMEEFDVVPKNFDDFVYLSQILQSKGISQGLKAQQRNQPYCMGSMYWQLNDAWPAISWSGIEYNGQWKPMQYAVRNAYEPYLVSHEIKDSICSIYTISKLDDSLKTTLRIRVMDFNGNTSFDTTILALQNGKVSKLQYQLNISKFNPHRQFIFVEYLLQDDFLLNQEFIYLAKDKDLELPKAKLEISQSFRNGRTIIRIKAHTLIRNIWFTRTDGKLGRFNDNNFDLAPDYQYIITIESDQQLEFQWKCLNDILIPQN